MLHPKFDPPATYSYECPTGGVRYYFKTDTRALGADVAATQNDLAIALQPGGGRESTNTSTSMGKVTKLIEDVGRKKRSKKQRRFERRLAERGSRRQGGFAVPTNESQRNTAADPSRRPSRVRGERSRGNSFRTPGFQEPGIRAKRKGTI